MNKKLIMNVRKSLSPCPVFIDGISRSGKGAVGVALAGLARTEHISSHNIIDRLFTLYSIGLIDRNAALDNIVTEANFKLWFNYLGRNLNTNIHDFTSVINSRDPEMYEKRMENHDNKETFSKFLEFLEKEKPITLNISDEMLYQSDLFFEAFNNLKIVVVMRHPIDVAFAWHRTGRGMGYGKDPRVIHPTLNFNNIKNIPVFAIDWPDEYEKMKPLDRAVKAIITLSNNYMHYIKNMSENIKNNIIILSFENFVTNTNSNMKLLCKFLNTSYTNSTPKMLERARIPRKLNNQDFESKYYGLKFNSDKKLFDKLITCSNDYEDMFDCPFSVNSISLHDQEFDYTENFVEYLEVPKFIKGKRIN